MANNALYEGTDKAAFLRWLMEESFIGKLDDRDINRICNRWIKRKIAEVACK